jgi:hypothetical protein
MSFRGFTALHYAVITDDIDAVKALLEGGADPTIKTAAGYLPVDFAQHSPAMKELLVSASAEVLSLCFICVVQCVICRLPEFVECDDTRTEQIRDARS